MRRKFLIKAAISLALVIYLSTFVHWVDVLKALSSMNTALFSASFLFAFLEIPVNSFKYSLMLKGSELKHNTLSLMLINLVSRFYAILIPSALAVEAIRWYKVTRNETGRTFFLAVTVFERLIFLLILCLCGMWAIVEARTMEPLIPLATALKPMLAAGALLCCIGISYFLSERIRGLLNAPLKKLVSPYPNAQWFARNIDRFSISSHPMPVLATVLVISLFWQCIFLGRMYFLFNAVGIDVSLMSAAWIGSLVLLLQIMPVSFAGIGVREGAYAYIFGLMGTQSELGVAAGLIFFAQMLLLAFAGASVEVAASGKTQ